MEFNNDDDFLGGPGEEGSSSRKFKIYHESVELPMFYAKYEVIVGMYMDEILTHMRELVGGVELIDREKFGSIHIPGYTCVVKGPMVGTNFYVFVCINEHNPPAWPRIEDTIVHEATHLSWFILDNLNINITADNHEIQCYMMEHLVRDITHVTNRAKERILPNEL
jgi:hypothetical protein